MSTFDSLQHLLADERSVRMPAAEVCRIPGSWVVQLAEHSPLGSHASVDDVHPATVVVASDRVKG